jgi:SHS2 domain-containing protein
VTGTYELLEHTADIGIRARGDTREEAFGAAARALAELQDAWFPGEGRPRRVEVEASDLEALLVAWLDEVLYLQDGQDLVFGEFTVTRVDDGRLSAEVLVAPRGDRILEATGVKAATYHGLEVREDPGQGCVARVYLDV